MTAVHPVAAAVFEALDARAVRWCVLRGEDRLAAPSHDIDLLVARRDLATMRDTVHGLGFAPVPNLGRGPHRFFVKRAAPALLLDVVVELAYGPAYAMRTGAADGCLARRRRAGSVAVPAPDDAFWTLLLHCMLDRGAFRAHEQERLRELSAAARHDGQLGTFTASTCPPGWDPERIVRAVERGDWRVLERLGPLMANQWRRRHRLSFVLRSLAHRLAWRLAPLFDPPAPRAPRVAGP